MSSKRYYWLKLKNDFFIQPKIKKLRRIAGGDSFTIIYLKLMLLTIQNNGIIEHEGIEDTLEEELSLKLDEDETNISVTLNYLFTQKLLVKIDKTKYELEEVKSLTGSETSTAGRMRKSRSKKLVNCNNVTPKLQRVT